MIYVLFCVFVSWELMSTLRHDVVLRVVKLFNVVLLTLPFAACWFYYYLGRTYSPFYRKGNWLIVLLYVLLYLVFARVYDAFMLSTSRISELVYSQSLSTFVADAIMLIVIWLLTKFMPNVLPMMCAFLLQVGLSAFWSFLAHTWYFKTFTAKNTAIIFNERSDFEKLFSEYGLEKKFKISITDSIDNCLNNLDMLKGLDAVFLADIHSHERNTVLKYCIQNKISVYVIPRTGDVIMSGAKHMHMFHLPMLRVSRYHPTPEYVVIKRLFDIVFSLVAIVVLSPIMLVVSIAIKMCDGGPVIYKQCRLTRGEKLFYIYKFRSMRVDAESDGVARLSTGDVDDRVTPVGKIIRKLRIDELPQLFNILSGDMTVVGPRPERPEIALKYQEQLPEFNLRLQVKAGLTGYAQVYGKYNTTPYDKFQMDLMYISHPSFLVDLRIIFTTIKILFLPESTEGVTENIVEDTKEVAELTK